MEKAQTESEAFIPKRDDARLVRDNKFRVRRHNVLGWMFARDLYHTLLSLHSGWIFLVLVLAYVFGFVLCWSIHVGISRLRPCSQVYTSHLFRGREFPQPFLHMDMH